MDSWISAVFLFLGEGDGDPQLRVWTCTLDGHDFYVVRLGAIETLVYDVLADQWYVWGSGNQQTWLGHIGVNWEGGDSESLGFGSNIVVGDAVKGTLYFLNPDQGYDEDATDSSTIPFERVAQGQIVIDGRDKVPSFGVQLVGSFGEMGSSDEGGVTLRTSDDAGNNYINRGTITPNDGAFNARVEWRSLGSMGLPGRLFKVTDYGSLTRLDGLVSLDA